MVKNIIFDLGNVIALWHPEEQLDFYVDNEFEKEFLLKLCFNDEVFHGLDSGAKTLKEMVEELQKEAPEDLKKTVELALGEWWRLVPFEEEVLSLIRDLKAKYGIYLLSNTNEVFERLRERDEIFSLFDGMILSYEEKCVKPEAEIYEKLFKRFDLEPTECYFIDDRKENIEAAKKFGMDGFVFTGDVRKLREDLGTKGVTLG
ncbi:HAD family hydrolase [Guggenheimella bovis]